MDANWRRSPGCLIDIAVRHAEKGVFALSLVFLLASVYGASRRETLSWSPEDLDRLTKVASEHIEATLPPRLHVIPYSESAKQSMQLVSAASYAHGTPFDPPIWPTRKRSRPDIYPIRELVASADRGAFAEVVEAPVGGYESQGVRGERWVCLTGVIQNEMQTDAFRDALWQASFHDVRSDLPEYVYYRVERAEVDPRRPEAEPHWVRQHVRNMFLRQQTWSGCCTDLVDPRYLPPEHGGISLVYPLGPLVDRSWGPEVCHPRIPLRETQRVAQTSRQRGKGNRALGNAREAFEQPEFLLFRYFDFDVLPEKEYRYRVRIVLANPNYAVPAPHLEDETSAHVRYLETEWSKPSDVVRIPSDTEMLAGPAKTWGARATVATVMMTRFLMSTGKLAFEEFQVRRGQVLDFAERVFRQETASVQVASAPFLTEGMTSPVPSVRPAEHRFKQPTSAPSRKDPTGIQAVSYSSGMLLLDVRGGERMPGPDRFTEPATLLLMDSFGNLVVRNELNDLPEYRSNHRAEHPPEATYADKKPTSRGQGTQTISLE